MVVVDANATVVNIFTLEVADEDISTEGEAKGLKTAHETLLDEAGWTRPYCFGGAVQKGKFRPVSGLLNGLREGHKAVTEPGYAGQLSAYGTLADTLSEELEAFKKFTKEKENREKAQIPEEVVRVALHFAASREHGLKKASFSMDPLLEGMLLKALLPDLPRDRSPCHHKRDGAGFGFVAVAPGGCPPVGGGCRWFATLPWRPGRPGLHVGLTLETGRDATHSVCRGRWCGIDAGPPSESANVP